MANDNNLQEVFKRLNKQYKNCIITPNDIPSLKDDIISTGIMSLDSTLGVGGIRMGSIVEIYGPKVRVRLPWHYN